MRRHFSRCLFAVGFMLAAANTGGSAQETQVFVTIDVPGATSTVALDINPSGDIVGSYTDGALTHGYVLSGNGELTSIDFPGAIFTRVAGINARRDIVGMYRLASEPTAVRHGFLFSQGVFTTIDPPGALFSNALGINEWGDIVGRFCTTLPCRPEGQHGFLLSDDEFRTIDIPGAIGTNAWKVNPRGDIVGGFTAADGHKHVYLLRMRRGDFLTIDVPGAAETAPENGGINARGDIVSVHCDTAPCRGASLDAHGFLLSRGLLTTIDVPGAISTNAFGINERGDIVGVYEDAAGLHGFLLSRGQ